MDLPKAVAEAPYVKQSVATDAVGILQRASYTELAHALASTAIAPTTVARIIALNKRLTDSTTVHDNLEILSLARQLAAELVWSEAEFVAQPLAELLQFLAQMPARLAAMAAIVLFEFAKSHDAYYGAENLSKAHALLLSPAIAQAQPSYALKVASIPKLGLSTVLPPGWESAQSYFIQSTILLAQKQLYRKALQCATAAVAIRGGADLQLQARRQGILLQLIVTHKVTPLPSYIRGKEGRALSCPRCSRIASLFDSNGENAGDELRKYIRSEQESLRSFGVEFLLDQVLLSHEIKVLDAKQKVYRRCDWADLNTQTSVDTLVLAGYKGQLYETGEGPLKVEAAPPDLAQLYELLDQVVGVSQVACGTTVTKPASSESQFGEAFTFGDHAWSSQMELDDQTDAVSD